MRLTTVILLVSLLQVSASTFGQRITINQKNAALESVLKEIRKQSGYGYYYGNDVIPEKQKINIAVTNASLEEALSTALQGLELRFEIEDKVIVIKKKGPSFLDRIVNRIAAIDVHGRVVDSETGEGLPGATVKVKGGNKSASTDKYGDFFLEDVSEDAVLEISYIGYLTKEVKAGKDVGIIKMALTISDLQEVTINKGYYTEKKKFSTGNVGRVTAKDIEKQPVSNPLAALQGRVSGLEITQQTGLTGGNFTVRIRGTNSLKNGNDPLYIVDGVPFTSTAMSFVETSSGIYGQNDNIRYGGTSPLNSINPSDIESIEVLKDADATAIYGSRGSNGVILITTKKGQVGKTKIDFNFYSGAARVPSKMDLLKTKDYIEMRKEAYANDGLTPTLANGPDLLVWDTTMYTNWQKELIGGTANTTDAQISMSGGEKNTQFSIGAGYHKETTVFPGDNSNRRISTHVNLINTSLNNRLKTALTLNFSSGLTDLLAQDLTLKALTLPPNSPALYDENGEISWVNWDYNFPNPLSYLEQKYEARTNNLIGNISVSYAILHNLEIKANLGYTSMGMKAVTVQPVSALDPAIRPFSSNLAAFSRSDFQNWIVEPQLNWKPKLGSGQFDLLVGTQFLDQKSEGLAQYANGFANEALMKDIGSASSIFPSTSNYSQYRYHAVFGRINYSLKERYFINATGRRDGSSRFGPGKQFANFGAIGTAWIFSEESFLKSFTPMSFGKVRASYGIAGNDQIGDYQYLDTYTSSGTYQGNIGLTPVRLSNPDFAWETNRKLEVALDLGFFKDRIITSISFYRNRSSNQLVGFPLPPTAGFSSIQGNFPATVQNTGIEIELNTTNIKHSEFIWSTSIYITIPRNKLLEFPGLATSEFADTYVIGEPLQIRKLYSNTGIDQTTGLYQFADVNGDGVYNFADRNIVKFEGQDFYGGVQNNLKYKGFQFDFLFQFVKQSGLNYISYFGLPGTRANQPEFVMDRWQFENPDSDRQRFSRGGIGSTGYNRYRSSEAAISDASFIRLKNISFSYTFPKKWIERIHAENARIFIQGQNILTITNYKGLDPETQSGSYLPPLKVLTGGISLTF